METLRKGSKGEQVKLLQRALDLEVVDGIFGILTERAVKAFQISKLLYPDGIVGPKTWAKLGISDATYLGLKRSARTIKEIIIHCTASPEGQNVTVEDVRRLHVKQNGWNDIGYHYLIYLDGSVHTGRDVDIIGAHCTGHNANSIGICYVGGIDKKGKGKDTRTPAQKAAMKELLGKLKDLYPYATIHGHNEYANKECPCFNVKKEYAHL